MNTTKIAFIGAGSPSFSLSMFRDIFASRELAPLAGHYPAYVPSFENEDGRVVNSEYPSFPDFETAEAWLL